KTLQRDPEYAPAYFLRARLEMLWDLPEFDPEAALADARKSVELGPNDDNNHWALGWVLFQLGHFNEAIAEFETILHLNPHPNIAQSGFHAIARSAAGHYEKAIAEIESVIAAHPKNPAGLSFRALVQAFGRRYTEAAISFEQARELDPDSA